MAPRLVLYFVALYRGACLVGQI
uniref:Uncharacterized protein n=1 Tax=Anguilla anguilla TaxID=7936 RepID=A0A0E9Q9D8_ANGAN